MTRLHTDQTFHFELLRALGAASYKGADVAEVLGIGARLETGDFEGWYRAFVLLAERVEATANESADPVSRRDCFFRAATYYRSADFFLHGKPEDSRIDELWRKQRLCFDAAIALLPIPGERLTIRAAGFDIPAVFYRASQDTTPRATILICSGFDGSQEELMHINGFAALERGYNVLTFEGPGQPTVVREQKLGFIHDWERVVTPVVDYALTRKDVGKLALIGMSMGGYLVARAAAFEHRLAATVCIDGIASMFPTFAHGLPRELLQMLDDDKNRERFDALMAQLPKPTDAKLRWASEHAPWAFCTGSAFELFNLARKMTMAGLGARVRQPVLVCDAARDHFFDNQPAELVKIIGDRATHYVFEEDELAAAEHCHVGASVEMNRVTFEWLANVFNKLTA